jgi:hypothetical protein
MSTAVSRLRGCRCGCRWALPRVGPWRGGAGPARPPSGPGTHRVTAIARQPRRHAAGPLLIACSSPAHRLLSACSAPAASKLGAASGLLAGVLAPAEDGVSPSLPATVPGRPDPPDAAAGPAVHHCGSCAAAYLPAPRHRRRQDADMRRAHERRAAIAASRSSPRGRRGRRRRLHGRRGDDVAARGTTLARAAFDAGQAACRTGARRRADRPPRPPRTPVPAASGHPQPQPDTANAARIGAPSARARLIAPSPRTWNAPVKHP